MKRITTVFLFVMLILSTEFSYAENKHSSASFDFDDSGIKFIAFDTTLSVIMRFRMQNQMSYNTVSDDDLSAASTEMGMRRMRLRFGGILYKDFSFNIQLGFARPDWDATDSDVPNIIRDAIAYWNFSKNAQIGFGQTKLPGNRQRMISSGDQQFADRSIVNSRFTLDRDFGFQGFYALNLDDKQIIFRGALSTGDGRYATAKPGFDMAYTGRVEFLPFGKFKSNGDYFEGDLFRESTPKLSLAVGYSHNENAVRTRGQLGPKLLSPRTQKSILADAIFKYNGLGIYTEFGQRDCDNPLTGYDGTNPIYVYTGYGYLFQASYLIGEKLEIAGRVATVVPDEEIQAFKGAEMNRHITGVCTYYFHNHRAKAQFEITHNTLENYSTNKITANWIGRFNLELGI